MHGRPEPSPTRRHIDLPASKVLLPCLLAACLSPPAYAFTGDETSSPHVDADVTAVASREWPSGAGGRLRVVVSAQGFEHVSSRVVAQWLVPSDVPTAAWTVESTRTLVEPGFLVIAAPRLDPQDDAVRVELEGVHTYQSGVDIACTFDLLPDGSVRIVRACGD